MIDARYLQRANEAHRAGSYELAVGLYIKAMLQTPKLINSLSLNLSISKRNYFAERKNINKLVLLKNSNKDEICSVRHRHLKEWYGIFDIFGNYLIKDFEALALDLSGPQVKWDDSEEAWKELISFVGENRFDIVHIIQPNSYDLILGVLYKVIWHSNIVYDFVADVEEIDVCIQDAIGTVIKSSDISSLEKVDQLVENANDLLYVLESGKHKFDEFDEVNNLPIRRAMRVAKGVSREVLSRLMGGWEVIDLRMHSVSEELAYPLSADPEGIEFKGFGIVRHNPLISIFIVSFNSSKDLPVLFTSLQKQSYKNFEIIFLENGIEDNKAICEQYFKRIKYLKEENVGFAEGNNICMKHATGEFFLLLNPDTRLQEDCIQSMLDDIRMDEHAAVVAPKIYFFEKFVTIKIESTSQFSLDLYPLLCSMDYRKYFVREGIQKDGLIFSNDRNIVIIDMPHPSINISSQIGLNDLNSEIISLNIEVGYKKYTIHRDDIKENNIRINFDEESYSAARFLINNAGSGIRSDGTPYDRGFAEYEQGHFLSKTYLSAFCGCAALVRKVALLNRKFFVSEFFAYYEDSELSDWLLRSEYRILYSPSSILYHRHSESTTENSPLWSTLVNRSFILYKNILSFRQGESFLAQDICYPTDINKGIKKLLLKYDDKVKSIQNPIELIKKKNSKKKICIYNTYYYVKGGGERHAIDFASLLQDEYEVYLASEVNFSKQELTKYFGVDLSRCHKIISTRIDTHFTSHFDIFINSTFMSNLISVAKKSYYLVSFPHKTINKDVLSCYQFLHNSPFTQRWASQYWGDHVSATILPIIGMASNNSLPVQVVKDRSILSVGRFTSEGHCKNFHLIIDAFIEAKNSTPLNEWTLYLVGSYDASDKASSAYYEMLINKAKDHQNIVIIPNIPHDDLARLYATCFIYVHATGLGVPASNPEQHEHFGIVVHESIANGCYPIVYKIGGPAEYLKGIQYFSTYDSVSTLSQRLLDSLGLFDISVTIAASNIDFANLRVKNNLKIVKKIMS